jgi:hypothetical protein
MRVYREIESNYLIELPYYDYRVSSCQDGCMIAFDQELNKHTINFVDKFIEIEFKRAD